MRSTVKRLLTKYEDQKEIVKEDPGDVSLQRSDEPGSGSSNRYLYAKDFSEQIEKTLSKLTKNQSTMLVYNYVHGISDIKQFVNYIHFGF